MRLNNYGLVPQKLCIKIHLSSLLAGYLKHLSLNVERILTRENYTQRGKRDLSRAISTFLDFHLRTISDLKNIAKEV